MQTELDYISDKARRDGRCRINNVAYLLNEENLAECFGQLKKGKAAGTDGVTLEEYGKNLGENLRGLVERMKRQAYKPQPVRRSYIPKANGGKRPLGIPAIEDKIVQKEMTRILEAVYEADFQDCSYGFRPNRGCHQALNRLDKIIMTQPINHIIDANIYLHYVLDLWVERVVKARCRGVVEMVRYADDFVICVQYKDEAESILKELKERLAKFSLELAEDKTRCIAFGRFAKQNAEAKGEKPATFDFLGFTHFIDKTRAGKYKLGRKTERKRLAAKLKALNVWLKSVRNMLPLREVWKTLKAKLAGHFRYYGVSGNFRGIKCYGVQAVRLAMEWLNRRSQKKSFNWKTFAQYMERHPLPKPTIHHNFYDLKPMFVNATEEPYVGKPQVRFCEGH